MLSPRLKQLLARVPGLRDAYQQLKRWRDRRQRIEALVALASDGRLVHLHADAGDRADAVVIGRIARDIASDYRATYGSVPRWQLLATPLRVPAGAMLLGEPLALLPLPAEPQAYLAQVGDKTRNMLRKAERSGYRCQEFAWNDQLAAIFAINTSKEVRASGRMHGWYLEPVPPRYASPAQARYLKYYGVFQGTELVAYTHVVLCGDHAFIRHFIGHAAHLKYGIMNLLVAHLVATLAGHPTVKWLKYGSVPPGAEGSVYAFRKHAGFGAYTVMLHGAGRP